MRKMKLSTPLTRASETWPMTYLPTESVICSREVGEAGALRGGHELVDGALDAGQGRREVERQDEHDEAPKSPCDDPDAGLQHLRR